MPRCHALHFTSSVFDDRVGAVILECLWGPRTELTVRGGLEMVSGQAWNSLREGSEDDTAQLWAKNTRQTFRDKFSLCDYSEKVDRNSGAA